MDSTEIEEIIKTYKNKYNKKKYNNLTKRNKKNLNKIKQKELIFEFIQRTSKSYEEKQLAKRKLMLLSDSEGYYKTIEKLSSSVKKCELCNSTYLEYIENGTYFCSSCEHITSYILDDEKYNEINEINIRQNVYINNSGYQKIKYYQDYLDTLQMKKIQEIPEEILTKLKNGHTRTTKITPKSIKRMLVQINKAGYCKFISYIHYILTGKPPPYISPKHEEYAQVMFSKIREIWPEIKGETSRKSFIGYQFCTYKILELIGKYDKYLDFFKMTSSQTNMEELDKIWKLICKRLNWEFIPTYVD